MNGKGKNISLKQWVYIKRDVLFSQIISESYPGKYLFYSATIKNKEKSSKCLLILIARYYDHDYYLIAFFMATK